MYSSQSQLNSLAEQDLELLSAYLDNRLSPAERVSLERRLAGDPRLQSELEALRSTVTALRALEPAPLPRSFTLDPAMVARPRTFFPLSWVMQMGSGFAGLALVLLATVQLLAAGTLPVAPVTRPVAAPTALVVGPTTMAAAAAAPLPAAEMRQPEATSAPAAPEAPAAADMAAQASADGVAGGSQSNSPVSEDASSASATGTGDTVQSSESSSPITLESALQPGPKQAAEPAAPGGINPGLTLALGILLIGLGLGWNLITRRRA